MKLVFVLLMCAVQLGLAQGWQQVGPDSVHWQGVYRLNARWDGPGSFFLAASTWNGVPIYSSTAARRWNYVLKNIPESIISPWVDYLDLWFSPFEPDSVFIGFDVIYVEGSPRIGKFSFPIPYPPYYGSHSRIGGQCWFGPLTMVFPPTSDSVIYATACGVHRSADRGRTWQELQAEPYFSFSNMIGCDRVNPSIAYRALSRWDRRGLFRTTNRGATWDSIYADVPSRGERAAAEVVAHADTILLSLNPFDTLGARGILRSTNAGVSWSQVYSAGRIAALALSQHGIVFGAGERGVIKSNDFGVTWFPHNNGLPT
ncbi:MAG: hypothetical protein AAB393_13730, partial [Bacteroidota bacterium]